MYLCCMLNGFGGYFLVFICILLYLIYVFSFILEDIVIDLERKRFINN